MSQFIEDNESPLFSHDVDENIHSQDNSVFNSLNDNDNTIFDSLTVLCIVIEDVDE